MPDRWPTWFNPVALDLAADPYGPFAVSKRLTIAGDLIAVGTPGHTASHVSVIAVEAGIAYFMAGDASYTEALMLNAQIDGVGADDEIARATLEAIRQLAAERPTVYLPTHDPASAERLGKRAFAQVTPHQPAVPKGD